MSEFTTLTKAYELSNQPVIIVRKARVAFMNKAAKCLLGKDSTEAAAGEILPVHVLNTQAETFVTTASINGISCTMRVAQLGGSKVVAISGYTVPPFEYSDIFASLRSIMTSIRFVWHCMSALSTFEGGEKLGEYLCSLNHSYYELKSCIENVGTLDAISKNALAFYPRAIDLTALCAETIDSVRLLLDDSGVELSFHSEERINLVADRALLQKLLLNLISNSIANTARGGHISVSLLRIDKSVVISVDDNGRGMDSDELSLVFDRTMHLSARPSDARGAGLGLVIVRGIAERHNGAVIIESRGRDKGSSVRVMLSDSIAESCRFTSEHPEYTDGSRQAQLLTALSACLDDERFKN